MSPSRLAALMAGHALAEGSPVGEALRRSGWPRAIAAAGTVDAGRLAAGLVEAGLDADLSRLAESRPGAVKAAQRRLSQLPSAWELRTHLGATLLLLAVGATVYALILAFLHVKVVPVMERSAGFAHPGSVGLDWDLSTVTALGVAGQAGGVVLLLLLAVPPERLPFWGGRLTRAREAALAAAVAEVEEQAGTASGSPRVEDLVYERALAGLARTRQRLVAAVRLAGLSALATVAAATTLGFYEFLAEMWP